jgi:hypothetical protein
MHRSPLNNYSRTSNYRYEFKYVDVSAEAADDM